MALKHPHTSAPLTIAQIQQLHSSTLATEHCSNRAHHRTKIEDSITIKHQPQTGDTDKISPTQPHLTSLCIKICYIASYRRSLNSLHCANDRIVKPRKRNPDLQTSRSPSRNHPPSKRCSFTLPPPNPSAAICKQRAASRRKIRSNIPSSATTAIIQDQRRQQKEGKTAQKGTQTITPLALPNFQFQYPFQFFQHNLCFAFVHKYCYSNHLENPKILPP